MNQRNYRNILFISLSQFGIAFSFNFVMVFIPFLIHDISPYSSRETLIWVGLIMGVPSFVAALASTFWGSLTSRFSSKLLYMRGLLSHTILILLMGFVSGLPILLMLRIFQGVLGGISTVGLFIVSSSSSKERASRDIGFFQNSMTLGQLMGPPMGALAASTLGYRGAFISASALVFLTLAFCFFNVAEVPHEPNRRPALAKHTMNRRTIIGWGVCFTATVQLMFLPSVLPNVFQAFKVGETIALKWAGQVVMFYTATAMAGTYLLCRVAGKMRNNRLIMTVGTLGVVLQSLLCLSPGIISFVALRMLQTGMIAAVVPLIFSSFASDLDGRVIGFLNSSRFAGNALGPLIATFVLAFSSLSWLYLSVSALSLLALLGFAFYFGSPVGGVGEGGN
jgi:DHA1 family multidrug resistance protein-like MFS transporter